MSVESSEPSNKYTLGGDRYSAGRAKARESEPQSKRTVSRPGVGSRSSGGGDWIARLEQGSGPVASPQVSAVDADTAEGLYDYQKEAVRRALERDGRILLAHDMGLGKTVTGLTIMNHYRSDWPLLILCPKAVLTQWAEEVARWCRHPRTGPPTTAIVKGKVTRQGKSVIEFADNVLNNPPKPMSYYADGAAGRCKKMFLRGPYLRDALVERGMIVETFETAITWDRFEDFHRTVKETAERVITSICGGGIVSSRVTHVYPDGAAPYFTVIAPAKARSQVSQWDEIKAAVSQALIDGGGTITHHHAVGRDHRPWYDQQRPELFAEALRQAKRSLDPNGILNPGCLVG